MSDFFRAYLCNRIENLPVFCKLKIKLLPLLVTQLLGVIQAYQGEALRQDDSGSHHGTGKRAPSRLIDTGYRANPLGMERLFMKKRRAP